MEQVKCCSIISDICPENNTECHWCCLYVTYHDFLRRSYERQQVQENPELLQEVDK